jgi:hypothetical protein
MTTRVSSTTSGSHRRSRKTKAGIDGKAEAVRRSAGIYWQWAGRAEPVVYEAVGGLGRRQTETRRRGLLRSFHRRSPSARNTPLTLAAGQGAATMYLGSAQATAAAHLGACLVASMGNWPGSDGRRSWPPGLTPPSATIWSLAANCGALFLSDGEEIKRPQTSGRPALYRHGRPGEGGSVSHAVTRAG